MLNPITFTINRESGPLAVEANGLDYVAYEDEFDKATLADIAAGRYKTFMFLCWHAMHRQSLTEQTFDEFLAESPTFSSEEKVEDIAPLASAPPTGS